jgi:hypothetical protein
VKHENPNEPVDYVRVIRIESKTTTDLRTHVHFQIYSKDLKYNDTGFDRLDCWQRKDESYYYSDEVPSSIRVMGLCPMCESRVKVSPDYLCEECRYGL